MRAERGRDGVLIFLVACGVILTSIPAAAQETRNPTRPSRLKVYISPGTNTFYYSYKHNFLGNIVTRIYINPIRTSYTREKAEREKDIAKLHAWTFCLYRLLDRTRMLYQNLSRRCRVMYLPKIQARM